MREKLSLLPRADQVAGEGVRGARLKAKQDPERLRAIAKNGSMCNNFRMMRRHAPEAFIR